MATPEEIIRGARMPTASVPLCMRADLVAEHERLERELERAMRQPADSLESGGAARSISERLVELESEMESSIVEFRLQGLPRRRYNRLVEEHPSKEEGLRFDAETFFPALIRRCTVSPVLPDETWRFLFGDSDMEVERLKATGREDDIQDGALTDRQFDQLAEMALGLNRRDVDVPFSHRASRLMAAGAPE